MKLKVPQSWKHVTIKQYSEYKKLCESKLSNLEHVANTISIMCDVPYEKVAKFSIKDLTRAYELMHFLQLPPSKPLKKRFIRIGLYFYRVLDPSKVSFGQYITAKEHSKPDIIDECLQRVLACYLVRLGKPFTEKEYTHNCEYLYNHMSIEDAYGLALFFYQLYNELNKAILNYSVKKVEEQIDLAIATLQTVGDGGRS